MCTDELSEREESGKFFGEKKCTDDDEDQPLPEVLAPLVTLAALTALTMAAAGDPARAARNAVFNL